jgi:hypothetical protein
MAKHVQATLDDELGAWVDKTLEHGQKGAFIVACFENLRKLMTEGILPPPSEYARQATYETVKDMAKGGGNG